MIKRYVEAGFGLPWPVSTEDELEDGTEVRVRGLRPVRPRSIYIRGQFRTRVAALDLLSGLKWGRKPYRAYKLVIGVRGRVRPRREP